MTSSPRTVEEWSNEEVIQDDLGRILLALGLSDHARPFSAHRVVEDEILPAIAALLTPPPTPAICSRCGLTEGEPGFAFSDGTICNDPIHDRRKPILGPVRCVCDVPEQPYRVVNGGMWGTLACRRCARLLLHQPATPVPPSSGGEPREYRVELFEAFALFNAGDHRGGCAKALAAFDGLRESLTNECGESERAIAALRKRVEAAERALASLAKAATRVNDRYIGGSRLNGPLGGAIEKLAEANAPALALLRATSTEASDAE